MTNVHIPLGTGDGGDGGGLPDATGQQRRVLAVGGGDTPVWTSDIRGRADGDATGANIEFDDAETPDGGEVNVRGGNAATGGTGGSATLYAGLGDGGETEGAELNLHPGDTGGDGGASFKIGGSRGLSGEALVSDGDSGLVYGGVQTASGAPSAAPDGFLPFYFDTTAVSGGFYYWNGSGWVKVATIL